MEALRRLSFQEKMAGKVGSMSAMVRAAIDTVPRGAPSREPLTRSPERPNEGSSEHYLARTTRTTHRTGLYNPLPRSAYIDHR